MNDSVKFSQNFLHSPRFVATLLARTSIATDDIVYDIGGGKGIITAALADASRTVISIEIDPQVAAKLRRNMAERANVAVFEADFRDFPLPVTPYKVFANIPFNLSHAIVRKLVFAERPPDAAYLIVQKEFAESLLPQPRRRHSRLAMHLAGNFAVRILKRLEPTDFYPRPSAQAVLVEIVPRALL